MHESGVRGSRKLAAPSLAGIAHGHRLETEKEEKK